jgi:hypothetical protein
MEECSGCRLRPFVVPPGQKSPGSSDPREEDGPTQESPQERPGESLSGISERRRDRSAAASCTKGRALLRSWIPRRSSVGGSPPPLHTILSTRESGSRPAQNVCTAAASGPASMSSATLGAHLQPSVTSIGEEGTISFAFPVS